MATYHSEYPDPSEAEFQRWNIPLTGAFRFAELCARGDLNSSERHDIGVHPGSLRALLGVDSPAPITVEASTGIQLHKRRYQIWYHERR
jgi:hypothetical protein